MEALLVFTETFRVRKSSRTEHLLFVAMQLWHVEFQPPGWSTRNEFYRAGTSDPLRQMIGSETSHWFWLHPRKLTARPPEKSKEIHQGRVWFSPWMVWNLPFQVLTSGENGTHQPINQWSRMSQRLPTSSPDGGTSLLHIHANRHVRDHHYRSWIFLPSNHRAADPVWRQKVEWDEKSDRQGAKTPVELEKEREIAIMYSHCGSVSTITYILSLTLPSFHHHPFHHHHQPKSGRKNIL